MRYSLKALGRQGVVQLQIDAEDADQARRQAEDQGLRVLSLRSSGGTLRGMAWRREAAFDLVLFSQELSTLLNAGLPLIVDRKPQRVPLAGSQRLALKLPRRPQCLGLGEPGWLGQAARSRRRQQLRHDEIPCVWEVRGIKGRRSPTSAAAPARAV